MCVCVCVWSHHCGKRYFCFAFCSFVSLNSVQLILLDFSGPKDDVDDDCD